jgi:hypothetical protein
MRGKEKPTGIQHTLGPRVAGLVLEAIAVQYRRVPLVETRNLCRAVLAGIAKATAITLVLLSVQYPCIESRWWKHGRKEAYSGFGYIRLCWFA